MPSGDWPEYETPAEVGGSPSPAPTDVQGDSSSPPAGGTPVPGSSDPGAATTGGDVLQPSSAPAGEPTIPQSRFDEVNTRAQQVWEQNQQLLAQVARMTEAFGRYAPGQTPAAPAPEPLDEREQKIVGQMDRLLQHTPAFQRLAPILERMDVLLQLADDIPRQRQSESQHWKTVADRTVSSLHDKGAELFLGPGKKAADLDPERRAILHTGFHKWVEADLQRVTRYENHDPALVTDFLEWFRGWAPGQPAPLVQSPEQRRLAAQQQARGELTRRLPTAGANGQPVAAAPPKVNNSDEEAVHSAGWSAFTQQVGASR